MPDPALSAAIREAYASTPVEAVVLHTLEIWHPSFTAPIRVVRDRRALEARLEPGAPRDAGAIVTFVAWAFDVVPPDQTTTGAPRCIIEIDNVSREIGLQLDRAIMQPDPVEVIYRPFLSTTATLGPEADPPLTLTMTAVTVDPFRIRATCGFPDLLNLKFPRRVYDLETFPGLAP